jgi:hypothetical protein
MGMNRLRFALVFLLVASGVRSTACPWGASDHPPAPPKHPSLSGVTVTQAPYYAWKAIVLRNRTAEVIVVPAIGRVMQFNSLDEKGNAISGPFWNNPEIGVSSMPIPKVGPTTAEIKLGPPPNPSGPQVAGRAWPPPRGFDPVPFTASINGSRVELLSPVDPS